MVQPPNRRAHRAQPNPNRGNSTLAIGGAVALLLIVTAIVAFIIFGLGGGDNGNDTDDGAVLGTTGTPIASPTTDAGASEDVTPASDDEGTDQGETLTPEANGNGDETPAPGDAASGNSAEETPPAAPTVAPTPLVGDFGELPAGDIPSGSNAPGELSLEYRLDMSLQQVPAESSAYQFERRTWTTNQVSSLAGSLGLDGNVVDQGAGSYRVSADGELYVSGNLVQYIADASAQSSNGSLPDDDALMQAARSWLIQHNVVGGNVGNGEVANRNDNDGRALIIIRPADPDPILSVIPSASITLGRDGQVLEANIRWPASFTASRYGLRPAEQLWNDASQGRGYVEVDPAQLPSGQVSGVATITSVSIAYTSAGAPDTQQYLVPLVVFNGQVQLSGGDTIPVSIYVSAAAAQEAPRG